MCVKYVCSREDAITTTMMRDVNERGAEKSTGGPASYSRLEALG